MVDSLIPPLFPDEQPQGPQGPQGPKKKHDAAAAQMPPAQLPIGSSALVPFEDERPVIPQRWAPITTQEERDKAFVQSFAFASRHDPAVRAEIRKIGT